MTVIFLNAVSIPVPASLRSHLPNDLQKGRLSKNDCAELRKRAEDNRWHATWLRETVAPQLRAAAAKNQKRATVMVKGVGVRMDCTAEAIQTLLDMATKLWDMATEWFLVLFNGQVAAEYSAGPA